MKIRKGFVSNSSSSSFIVIGKSNANNSTILSENPTLIIDNSFGNTEFGWEFKKYNDTGSKIIFCYLQAKDRYDWLKMLEDVIKENSNGVIKEIKWYVDGYIDHQSSASEGECIEMFKDKDTLNRFLFNNYSYIKTGNDNESEYWYCEN